MDGPFSQRLVVLLYNNSCQRLASVSKPLDPLAAPQRMTRLLQPAARHAFHWQDLVPIWLVLFWGPPLSLERSSSATTMTQDDSCESWAAPHAAYPRDATFKWGRDTVRGVNLGGWCVKCLEEESSRTDALLGNEDRLVLEVSQTCLV